MKRLMKYILAICISILAVGSIVASPSTTSLADSGYHNVTFNYNKDRVLAYLPDEDGTIESTLNSYTITVADGGYAVETRKPNNAISNYYSYVWTVDGVQVDIDNYAITKDTIFYASWTPKQYKVYFWYDGEKSEITIWVSQIKFNVESPRITLYKPVREHYVFKGWYENYNDAGAIQYLYIYPRSIGDKNLYARFSPLEYYIDYHTDATHNNPRGYNVEDDDFTLLEPTLEGHIFKGWFTDTNYTNAINSVDCSTGGNLNLYAKWDLETYKVTYILPNGVKRVVETQYGHTAELPKIDKSVFEIVKTSVSRNNITKDTVIEIELVNIWYVYVIALLVVIAIVAIVIVSKRKKEKTHNTLRTIYQANTNKNKRKY